MTWQTGPRHYDLYRLHNSDGDLLYIGMTCQIDERLMQHSREKSWYSEVSSTELEPFGNYQDAFNAELRAIEAEKPIYNVVGTNKERKGGYRKAPPLDETRADQLRSARNALNEAEQHAETAAQQLHAAMTAALEVDQATWQAIADTAGFNSVQAARYWHKARSV